MWYFFSVLDFYFFFVCQGTEAFGLKASMLLKAGHSISEATSPLAAGNGPDTWFRSCLQEPGRPVPGRVAAKQG